MLALRLCKAALVASVSFFFVVVVLDNLTDYGSNFEFVRHVLSMDDTFKNNAEKWRALPYPVVFHLFYSSIILWESTCAVSTAYGAYRLFTSFRRDHDSFQQAKIPATIGITICLLLWSVAFLTIGGEWFLMWQSMTWNGQGAASRMFTVDAFVLLFLWMPEPPPLSPKR